MLLCFANDIFAPYFITLHTVLYNTFQRLVGIDLKYLSGFLQIVFLTYANANDLS